MAKAISNIMRNVFGLAGVFVWAFASTTSSMVSNLMGQQREDEVISTYQTHHVLEYWALCMHVCDC